MTPEFHRPAPAERVGEAGFEQRVEADAAERAALARRLGVPALAALACRFRLTRAAGGAPGVIVAEGHLEAQVTRVCVVSLDEFEVAVEEKFRVRFAPAGLESDQFDLDADDEIPYRSGTIDLGEAAAEQLSLALDPYPRKPDAEAVSSSSRM
jgi:uncharacterized metal-binding protein YceD (DUF177 family)